MINQPWWGACPPPPPECWSLAVPLPHSWQRLKGQEIWQETVGFHRKAWGLQAQDQGNFLSPSPPPLSSGLGVAGCLQHSCHLLLDFRNQDRAELDVVNGQLGDTAQGLSGTRSVQLRRLGLTFRIGLT